MSEEQILALENRLRALESLETAVDSALKVLQSGAILAISEPGRSRVVKSDLDGALKEVRDEISIVKNKLSGFSRK